MIFWELTAGNTVTIIFDYRLCIAVNFSTLIESSGVKTELQILGIYNDEYCDSEVEYLETLKQL